MNKPILGICRGMQILNTYFNGKLYQDLSYAKGEILKHDQVRTPSLVTHKIEIEEGLRIIGSSIPVEICKI